MRFTGLSGVLIAGIAALTVFSNDGRAMVDRVEQPIVVPFPGPAWRAVASAEEQVVELLRRAIGYRVRLR